MIKLIASDIDGTLLPEGTTQINPEIFEVIRELKKKDILFAAASGRPYSSMSLLFEEIKNDIIFITENGAYVCCRGYSILENLLDWDMVREWLVEVRKIPDICFTLNTKDSLYTESREPEFLKLVRDGYRSKITVSENLEKENLRVLKMSIFKWHGISEIAKQVVPRWEKRLGYAIAGEFWIDFMGKKTNKGNAIRSIQETMKISPEETMVFGDNYNDLEMIKSATESYAVGNAVDAVKQAAHYIADTNVNDGVLKVLKTLL